MTVIYNVVEHDGGWAYRVGDVFSEAFATHDAALIAAAQAAQRQRVPGSTTSILYEDDMDRWHQEVAKGSDRPVTKVEDVTNPDQ